MRNAMELYFGNFKIPFRAVRISTAVILIILLFNMQLWDTGKLNWKRYLGGCPGYPGRPAFLSDFMLSFTNVVVPLNTFNEIKERP